MTTISPDPNNALSPDQSLDLPLANPDLDHQSQKRSSSPKLSRKSFISIKKRKSSLNTQLRHSPSSSSIFRSALIPPLLKSKPSLADSSFSTHPVTFISNSTQGVYINSKKSVSQSNLNLDSSESAPPVELPLLEIDQQYNDLTQLFTGSGNGSSDKPNSSTTPSTDTISEKPTETSKSLPKLNTSFSFLENSLTPIQSSTSALDLPDYSYYTDASSIDSSDHPTNSVTQNTSTQTSPNTIPSSKAASTPALTLASLSRQYSSTTVSLHSQNSTNSPILRQSIFSPAHSLSSRSLPSRYEPVTSENYTHYNSTPKPRKSHFALSKVKSIFSSSKSLHNTLVQSPTTPLRSVSDFSRANHSTFSFEGETRDGLGQVASEPLTQPPNESSDLPFSNPKPVQHFQQIDLGPTYKAKITPVIQSPSFKSITPSSRRPVTPASSNPTNSKTQATPTSKHVRIDSESLDFVPNLRPSIDQVGSRLRSLGVPSPANLVMTKEQYDKLIKQKNLKRKVGQEDGEKIEEEDEEEEEEEEEEEDDDDDDDEEDEEEQTRRIKRFEQDEEAKKHNIRMRLVQDAHLAVYRQKMTKLTGSQIGLSSNNITTKDPNADESGSEDEYDDVPLGILRAHGFPAPAHNAALKKTISQPNLTGILNESQKPAKSSDAFGEGHLAMRNSVAPPFSQPFTSRGLVAEIATEKEKLRRRSVNGAEKGEELSTQILKMMQLQTQILEKMKSQPDLPRNASQTNLTLKRNASQTNLPRNISQKTLPRSTSQTTLPRSASQATLTMHRSSSQTNLPNLSIQTNLPRNTSQPNFSLPRNASQPNFYPPIRRSSFDVMGGPQSVGGPMMRPAPTLYSPQIPSQMSRPSSQVNPHLSPRISRSFSYNLPKSYSTCSLPQYNPPLIDVSERSDDEDDSEWKEMQTKRQSLKNMWKAAPLPTTVS